MECNCSIGDNLSMDYDEMLDYCQTISKDSEYSFDRIMNDLEAHAVKKIYSTAKNTLLLGYYDPTIVGDIITGNVDRGKLYKRAPRVGTVVFEYGLDIDNKVLYAKRGKYRGDILVSKDGFVESDTYLYYFMYNDGVTILGYRLGTDKNDMFCVSKCVYEKTKLVEYCTSFLYGKRDILDIICEKYIYDNHDLLNKAILTHKIGTFPDGVVTNEDVILFSHDNEGYIVEYIDDSDTHYRIPKGKRRKI